MLRAMVRHPDRCALILGFTGLVLFLMIDWMTN